MRARDLALLLAHVALAVGLYVLHGARNAVKTKPNPSVHVPVVATDRPVDPAPEQPDPRPLFGMHLPVDEPQEPQTGVTPDALPLAWEPIATPVLEPGAVLAVHDDIVGAADCKHVREFDAASGRVLRTLTLPVLENCTQALRLDLRQGKVVREWSDLDENQHVFLAQELAGLDPTTVRHAVSFAELPPRIKPYWPSPRDLLPTQRDRSPGEGSLERAYRYTGTTWSPCEDGGASLRAAEPCVELTRPVRMPLEDGYEASFGPGFVFGYGTHVTLVPRRGDRWSTGIDPDVTRNFPGWGETCSGGVLFALPSSMVLSFCQQDWDVRRDELVNMDTRTGEARWTQAFNLPNTLVGPVLTAPMPLVVAAQGLVELSKGKVLWPGATFGPETHLVYSSRTQHTTLWTRFEPNGKFYFFRGAPRRTREVRVHGCVEDLPAGEALVRVGTVDVLTRDGCFDVRVPMEVSVPVMLHPTARWPLPLPGSYVPQDGERVLYLVDQGRADYEVKLDGRNRNSEPSC